MALYMSKSYSILYSFLSFVCWLVWVWERVNSRHWRCVSHCVYVKWREKKIIKRAAAVVRSVPTFIVLTIYTSYNFRLSNIWQIEPHNHVYELKFKKRENIQAFTICWQKFCVKYSSKTPNRIHNYSSFCRGSQCFDNFHSNDLSINSVLSKKNSAARDSCMEKFNWSAHDFNHRHDKRPTDTRKIKKIPFKRIN